jgi:hypothetical protein
LEGGKGYKRKGTEKTGTIYVREKGRKRKDEGILKLNQ